MYLSYKYLKRVSDMLGTILGGSLLGHIPINWLPKATQGDWSSETQD